MDILPNTVVESIPEEYNSTSPEVRSTGTSTEASPELKSTVSPKVKPEVDTDAAFEELLPALCAIIRSVPTLQLDTYMDFVTLTIARDNIIRDATLKDHDLGHVIRENLGSLITERIAHYTIECSRKNTANFFDYLEGQPHKERTRRRSSIFVHESEMEPNASLAQRMAHM